MADKVKFKAFPTAFKLAAIKRLEAGEAVLPLARKLGVSRKVLHDWRKAWKLDGPAGLNRKRGPKPGPARYARWPNQRPRAVAANWPRRARGLPNLNARSGNRRSISIFFTKPCAR
jgi:transposase-like protein